MKISILGGGLAGTAAAYVLRQAGLAPEIYEAGPELAGGASGNPLGLINPRFSAHRTPESDFFTGAFALAVRTFDQIQETEDIGWKKCGALHLNVDEKKQRRFPQTVENWGWPPGHMRLVVPEEAAEIAGVELTQEALYLPDSGVVSPRALCNFYARGTPAHLNTRLESLNDLRSDIIILAGGMGVLAFPESSWLPLRPVRGQITEVRAGAQSSGLRCSLCFGGYLSPAIGGVHTLGASFQRWLDHAGIMEEDDRDNIANLQKAIPALSGPFDIAGHRAAVRATVKDHFPLIGSLPGHPNIFISTGHGSHGIISSLAAAHLLTDMILKRPLSQSRFTVNALSPERFLNPEPARGK